MRIFDFLFPVSYLKSEISTLRCPLSCLLVVGILVGGIGCTLPCKCADSIKTEGVIAKGAELMEVSTEFSFTEGPATDNDGNVYFTDQPNNRIMIYTTDGKLETFMQPAGRSNGLYFDWDGSLIACADEKNELWRIDVETGQHIVLARRYADKPLNGPNDAWVHPDGGIYFTDPYYQRPWWSHRAAPQDRQCVYFLPADGTLPVRVAEDLQQPNGIIGTPDGKTLYVADIRDKKTWAYTIAADGTLTGKRLFCQPGSDGMTLDVCGNVYLTGDGVLVFSPAGEQIAHLKVPQRWTANVTFGGRDRKTLFITAGTGVYTLRMNVCGIR